MASNAGSLISEVASRRLGVTLATASLATLLFVASIAITVTQLVPLNELADSWSAASPPAEAAAIRDRWWGLHLVRTWFAVASFGLLVITTTIPNRRPRTAEEGGDAAQSIGTSAGGTVRVAQ